MIARSHSAPPSGFRSVPRTGVIFVMTEAGKQGYCVEDPAWANLGQGAPEVGKLPGAPERIQKIEFAEDALEYSPVDGLPKLKEAVAHLYNTRFRKGKNSQYTAENVAISAGGRLAMTRLVSTLGRTNIGHFLPDYTAYEELLDAFGSFVPIPILLDAKRGYEFSGADLEAEILGRGLSTLLLSNPCNPTGKLIYGDTLADWTNVARDLRCTIVFDEFYSHYTYTEEGTKESEAFSSAHYVEDVDEDPIVIIDGLTKNWRYPGFRLSWTVGPKAIIEAIASAGSFLDGGCPMPMQQVALSLLKPEKAEAEAKAIQQVFQKKRQYMLDGLTKLGITVDPLPFGGFYCWGNLSKLPEQFNTGLKFFEHALEEKVIVVPGEFFDIDPGRRRPDRPGRFQHFARFSFGPSTETLEQGLNALGRMLQT